MTTEPTQNLMRRLQNTKQDPTFSQIRDTANYAGIIIRKLWPNIRLHNDLFIRALAMNMWCYSERITTPIERHKLVKVSRSPAGRRTRRRRDSAGVHKVAKGERVFIGGCCLSLYCVDLLAVAKLEGDSRDLMIAWPRNTFITLSTVKL